MNLKTEKMKMINYNRNNSIERPKEARPLLTICLVGHIYMNPAALKMFGLENYPENYGVEFFKDPENDQLLCMIILLKNQIFTWEDRGILKSDRASGVMRYKLSEIRKIIQKKDNANSGQRY